MSENAQNQESKSIIGSDIPHSNPIYDAFGYASFAKLIATAIIKTPSPVGLVMAIHGTWGSGKTTLLNFVKHYISGESDDVKPVVIEFNPWWFDDHTQLAAQFLDQFKNKLQIENKPLRDIGDLLAKYSEGIGKVIVYSTGIPWLDKIANLLNCFKRKSIDVPSLKSEITKSLKKVDQPESIPKTIPDKKALKGPKF